VNIAVLVVVLILLIVIFYGLPSTGPRPGVYSLQSVVLLILVVILFLWLFGLLGGPATAPVRVR
jgi:hypothetical protein